MNGTQFKKSLITSLLVFVVAICFPGCDPGGGNGGTTGGDDVDDIATDYATMIPDAGLRSAIATTLGKSWGSITLADLSGLTVLDAGDNSIIDLTGISYCTGLTELYLWSNKITKVAPLANLKNISTLDLSDNAITDISTLSSLNTLNTLFLSYNPLPYETLSATLTAAHFPNLVGIDFCGYHYFEDTLEWKALVDADKAVEIVNRFPNLSRLQLREFETMTDVQLDSALAGRESKLKQLRIPGNTAITDHLLTTISAFENLSKLDISRTQITDTALKTSAQSASWNTKLILLRMNNCAGITDLGFLSDFYASGEGSFTANGSEISLNKLRGVVINGGSLGSVNITLLEGLKGKTPSITVNYDMNVIGSWTSGAGAKLTIAVTEGTLEMTGFVLDLNMDKTYAMSYTSTFTATAGGSNSETTTETGIISPKAPLGGEAIMMTVGQGTGTYSPATGTERYVRFTFSNSTTATAYYSEDGTTWTTIGIFTLS